MIWAAPALAGDYERALREATREKAIYRDAHPATPSSGPLRR